MQRFFAEQDDIDPAAQIIRLRGADVNHIRNVLRMKPGDELWVSDGAEREYHCSILETGEEEILLKILYFQEPQYELPSRILLFQGLPKGDKMEFIIQKAVELGAGGIVPVRMKRCIVRMDEKKAEKRRERWQQIAEAAAKQSRRMHVPEVYPVLSFEEALRLAEDLDVILAPYELAEGIRETKEIIEGIQPGQSVGIFIGPEGGFEQEEIRSAVQHGASPITLGRRILRTETAGMALLSVLMFRLEGDA